jgi:hypothetical protein
VPISSLVGLVVEKVRHGVGYAPTEIPDRITRQLRLPVCNAPKCVRTERQKIPAQLEYQQEEPKEKFERVHIIYLIAFIYRNGFLQIGQYFFSSMIITPL